MREGINVLSLFDGISCGLVALERAGVKVNQYFASEIDENAIAISENNHKNIVRLGDVTKWREWSLPKIDLVIAGSPCFPAGALVLREDGFVPIEEIKVGDMVMTHKGRLRKVLAVGSKLSDTVIVKGQGSIGIECTPNHPFYSSSKKYKWNNDVRRYEPYMTEPEWVEAKDMQGNFWLNVCNVEETNIPLFKDYNMGMRNGGHIKDFKMTEDFFYFVGRWLGDGWLNCHYRKNRIDSKAKKVLICCSHEESDFLEMKLSYTGLHFGKVDNGSTIRFTCSSTQLYDWLIENFGVHADGKNIPYWCFGMPENFRKAMYDGYIDADGTVYKNHIGSSSINRKLTVGMKLLAGSLHKAASVTLCNNNRDCVIDGRHVNENPLFTQRYYDNSRSAMFLDAGWFGLVRNVEQCSKLSIVYNLEVEEDNSYTVDGIAVHNCQGFSKAGKMLNFQDPQSKLFFEFVDILNDIKLKNNDVLFMLENVKMKSEWRDIITGYLGVKPIEINSKLVSAQNRERLYWTNIPNVKPPEDKGICLLDILEHTRKDDTYIEHNGIWFDPSLSEASRNLVYMVGNEVRVKQAVKKGYIVAEHGDGINLSFPTSKTRRGRVIKQKSSTLDRQCEVCVLYDDVIRRITVTELERLQTLPDGYTNGASIQAARSAIGNGWTVEVIRNIFSFLQCK